MADETPLPWENDPPATQPWANDTQAVAPWEQDQSASPDMVDFPSSYGFPAEARAPGLPPAQAYGYNAQREPQDIEPFQSGNSAWYDGALDTFAWIQKAEQALIGGAERFLFAPGRATLRMAGVEIESATPIADAIGGSWMGLLHDTLKDDDDPEFLQRVDDTFFNRVLPEAIGQTLTGVGLAARAGPAAKYILPAFGGTVMAEEFWLDAKANGATPREAQAAAAYGFAVGQTEYFAVSRLLRIADKYSGGGVSKVLGKLPETIWNGRFPVTKATIAGALTEGFEELIQQFGQNVVAADLVGYDPTRSWDENIGAAVRGGAGAGGLISMAAAALGIKLKRQRELEEKLWTDKDGTFEPSQDSNWEASSPTEAILPGTNLRITPGGVVGGEKVFALWDGDEILSKSPHLENLDFVGERYKDTGSAAPQLYQEDLEGTFTEPTKKVRDLAKQAEDRRRRMIENGRAAMKNKGFVKQVTEILDEWGQVYYGQKDQVADPENLDEQILRDQLALENSEGRNVMGEGVGVILQRQSPEQIFHVTYDEETMAESWATDIQPILDASADGQASTVATNIKKGRYVTTTGFNDVKQRYDLDPTLSDDQKSYASKALTQFRKTLRDIALNQMRRYLMDMTSTENGNTITPTDNVIIRLHDPGVYTGHSMVFLKDKGGKTSLLVEVDATEMMTELDAQLSKKSGDRIGGQTVSKGALSSYVEAISHEIGHAVVFRRFAPMLEKLHNRLVSGQQDAMSDGEMHQAIALVHDYLTFLRETQGMQQEEAIEFAKAGNEMLRRQDPQFEEVAVSQTRAMSNYHLSFDEYLAERVARYATQTLPDTVYAPWLRGAVKELKQVYENFPQVAEVEPNVQDWLGHLTAKSGLYHEVKKQQGQGKDRMSLIKRVGKGDNWVDNFGDLKAENDKWNKTIGLFFNISQISEQNPHIVGLKRYIKALERWAVDTTTILEKTEVTVKMWKNLKKERATGVSKVLFAENELQAETTLAQKEDIAGEWDAEMQAVYDQVKEDLRGVLAQMEAIAVEDARSTFVDDPAKFAKERGQIEKTFTKLKARPYFPNMRFGNYSVTVKAKVPITENTQFNTTRNYKPGDTVRFYTEHRRRKQKALADQLRRQYGDRVDIGMSEIAVERHAVQMLPATFLRIMKRKLPMLTKKQQQALDDLIQEYSPAQGFINHMKNRKGTLGFSMDGIRAYAAYMRNAASHISRLNNIADMNMAIKDVQDDEKYLRTRATANKRSGIAQYMKQHMEYVMNPGNEWVGLRSFMFQWFLGFNPKAAMLNSTQIPLVTLPYLGSRFGDGRAASALGKASKDSVRFFRGKYAGTTNRKDLDMLMMIEKLTHMNLLNQSLATEVAVSASEESFNRELMPAAQRGWYTIAEYGARMFHGVEKMNRHVTAIAAYRLAREDGLAHGAAVNAAAQAVNKTQFDYSRWNRPKFMWGKRSTVFLFMNYVQNAMYFALGGDRGAMRMWAMSMLLAGLEGLPGAENLLDVLSWIFTKTKELMGWKNPKTDARLMLRELVQTITDDPDLFLHGISSETFGLVKVGQMVGIPMPSIDMSASISLGRPLPATELLNQNFRDSDAAVGRLAESIGGAGASAMLGVMRGWFSDDPDSWKNGEKMLPAFVRNPVKAVRYAQREQEATAGGDVIATFDSSDPRDLAEIGLQALGFTPTRVSRGWEREIAVKEAARYYEMRKRLVLRALNFARWHKDREMLADARKAKRKYNHEVPFPEMSITYETVGKSYQDFVRSRVKAGHGIPKDLRTFRLGESIREAYEEK